GTVSVPAKPLGSDPVANGPAIASSPDGTATVIWTTADTLRPFARRLSATGARGALLEVDDVGETYPSDPTVATESDGTSTLAWVRAVNNKPQLVARRLAPDGTFADSAQVITDPLPAFPVSRNADAAAGPPGSSALAWWSEL